MKKDFFKVLMLTLIGFFVAIIGYPFLHEMGHILASVLVGAEVLELNLLPIPSVLCDVTGVSTKGLIAIGFGGTVFLLIVSLLIPRIWFLSWYFRVLLQGMSLLAVVVSCVSVLFDVNPQDDMIQVLNFWQHSKELLLTLLVISVMGVLTAIIIDRPLKRVCKFFGV